MPPVPRDAAAAPGYDAPAAERELVLRARAGDQAAFSQLVEDNRRAVYRAAFAALRSHEEADDVAQEAFVAAYQKLDGFRGDASFRTWVLSIAWRKALDRRRSVSRWLRLTVRPDPAAGTDPADAVVFAVDQEQALASRELGRAVARLIGTLPRKLRDALLLAGSGEYSYEQMAGMLGVPVGTVKWRVSEARRILKRKLAATGHTHE